MSEYQIGSVFGELGTVWSPENSDLERCLKFELENPKLNRE